MLKNCSYILTFLALKRYRSNDIKYIIPSKEVCQKGKSKGLDVSEVRNCCLFISFPSSSLGTREEAKVFVQLWGMSLIIKQSIGERDPL